jgi:enterochelin esterase-like enzyme
MHELLLRYDGKPRRVRVRPPPDGDDRPPVLVLFDGQNVFGDEGSFAGGWHADAAVDALPSTVRKPLIVGVDHGGAARIHELWRDLPAFLAFVERDVLPAVRGRFPTDPEHVAIGGSSLGGLAAFLAHLRDPETWPAAMVMAPSLRVDRGAPLRELQHRGRPVRSRIYLDVGERERGAMPILAAHLARARRARVRPGRAEVAPGPARHPPGAPLAPSSPRGAAVPVPAYSRIPGAPAT